MRRGGRSTVLCFNSAATWLKVKHVVVVFRFQHFLHVIVFSQTLNGFIV